MESLGFRPSAIIDVIEDHDVFDGLISSCCPVTLTEKAGKKKKIEIEFWRPLRNEYPLKSQNNQVVDGFQPTSYARFFSALT